MIQRLIFDALEKGVDILVKDFSLLDDMFGGEEYGYSREEIEAVKTIFKTTPPYPVHGYAQRDHTFPLWAIMLAGEQETERALADETGFVDDPDDPEGMGTDIIGSIWDHNYAVLTYSLNADSCIYCYEAARAILMLARREWVNKFGYHNIRLSGADLAPDPRYLPEHMFIRQLTVSVSAEHSFPQPDSRFGRAWKVAGMHVDKSGSPSDVGGVKTLIYPVEP